MPSAGSGRSLILSPAISKTFSWEVAFCSYWAKIFPPQTAAPCRTASGLRNDFFPVVAFIVSGFGDEDAVAGSIFVGDDVDAAVVDGTGIEKILAGGDADGRRAFFQVHQEELGLGPALLDGDEEQAAIVVEADAGPVFGVAAFAENFQVGVGIGAEVVIENVAVVHLLAVGNVAFLGITGVIEAGVVGKPGDAAGAGALDGVGELVAGFGFDDMEGAHFRAAGRGAVGEILSVLGRLEPVEGDGAVGGELVDVEQDAIFGVGFCFGAAFSDVKHGLVLHAFAAGVEIIFAADLWLADAADAEEFGEALVNGVAAGEGIEESVGISHLLGHPLLSVGTGAILEPAVVVDDLHSVERLLERTLLRLGHLRGRGSLHIIASEGRSHQKKNRSSHQTRCTHRSPRN